MFRVLRSLRAASLLGLGLTFPLFAAEITGTAEPAARATNEVPSDAQQAWRSYLHLQDQLRAAMLTFEQARLEAEASAKRTSDNLAERLKAIEEALAGQRLLEQAFTTQRDRDLHAMQSTNRSLLIVAGILAAVTILAMFCTVWFQMRALNRLAEITTLHRDALLLSHPPVTALGPGSLAHTGLAPVDASSQRLLGMVEQLEKRLQELEHAAQPPAPAPKPAVKSNGDPTHPTPAQPAAPPSASPSLPVEEPDRLDTLLGKGQSLLNLGQVEQAVACFDEAIALDPRHTEALMKKGHALERLQKLQEALDCYDRAIAANDKLTLAYVYKGGVYNQLERYDEALDCYEKALRAQQQNAQEVPAAVPA